jgi:hypothetical protein
MERREELYRTTLRDARLEHKMSVSDTVRVVTRREEYLSRPSWEVLTLEWGVFAGRHDPGRPSAFPTEGWYRGRLSARVNPPVDRLNREFDPDADYVVAWAAYGDVSPLTARAMVFVLETAVNLAQYASAERRSAIRLGTWAS